MGKVMLVTGGSRGIGAATARLAARDGWDVVVNYARNQDAARAVVAEVEAAGRKAVAIQADTGKPEDVVRLFAESDAAFGRLDAFINNAGIVNKIGRLDARDPADLQRIIAVNLTGAILGCAEAVRRMSTSHSGSGGSIVNVSSIASRLGGPGNYVDYAATKGGIDSLTIGLAQEVAGEGIRVNAVRPGVIDTDIHNDLGDEPGRVARMGATVPAKRAGTADEVAETIVWLCSDAASYVTMSLMDVSGGR
ncbi:MAG: SDR family oxidoreductase [Alphaproteobacteria bacterium]|jgi:NAD(P)-dependent dehydrogenase (short-subunit alcohol dehydrogenase family)